ncbi:hypothetical protein ABTK38_22125, partial [Acinetobacter baumannii]
LRRLEAGAAVGDPALVNARRPVFARPGLGPGPRAALGTGRWGRCPRGGRPFGLDGRGVGARRALGAGGRGVALLALLLRLLEL